MTDNTANLDTGGGSRQSSSASSGSSVAQLQTEHGTTTIADTVVSKIAALAAREVDGVAQLGGTMAGAVGSVVGRIRGQGQEHATSGVSVEVGTTQAAVDMTLQVHYPASLHQVADAVRQNVMDRIESMTGLEVTEVNIVVSDLAFPGQEDEGEDQQQTSRVQ